ncbi:MAG: hypothetical protein LAO09_18620 [Acidobacteriia bacterium]|nr:hypothetical protein [Terriglobia bacterium]
MANGTPRSSVLPQIIVAVVIALAVGGTSPWWWKELHRERNVPTTPVVNPSTPSNPVRPASTPESERPAPAVEIGGPIEVRCVLTPMVISPGGASELLIQATSTQNTPVSSANVKVGAGGGMFTSSGGITVVGTTAADGSFRTVWRSPDPATQRYGFNVSVVKPGFDEGENDCTVTVQ